MHPMARFNRDLYERKCCCPNCLEERQLKHLGADGSLRWRLLDIDAYESNACRGRASRFRIPSVPHGRARKMSQLPKQILFTYDEFLKFFHWDKPGFPPCGLKNCGNSCYVNVVLQCLACTRPLLAYFLEKGHSRTCIKSLSCSWCLQCELEAHIKKASESLDSISPRNILHLLPNIGGNLSQGIQGDAHEFMRFVIDAMQTDFLDEFGTKKSLDPSTHETNLIQHIFGGLLQSQVICRKCLTVSNRYENMLDLMVEIQGHAASLMDCLNQYTEIEWLEGENKYKCDGCNDYVVACKQLTIHQAPNILTIALKKFQNFGTGILNKSIDFPSKLDLTPYMSGKGDGSDQYTLYAVVVHKELFQDLGHYISYIKDCNGHWYRINDETVSQVELEEVLSQNAYMLLYNRICARRRPLFNPVESTEQQHSAKENSKSSSICEETDLVSSAQCLPCDVGSELSLRTRRKFKDTCLSLNNPEASSSGSKRVEKEAAGRSRHMRESGIYDMPMQYYFPSNLFDDDSSSDREWEPDVPSISSIEEDSSSDRECEPADTSISSMEEENETSELTPPISCSRTRDTASSPELEVSQVSTTKLEQEVAVCCTSNSTTDNVASGFCTSLPTDHEETQTLIEECEELTPAISVARTTDTAPSSELEVSEIPRTDLVQEVAVCCIKHGVRCCTSSPIENEETQTLTQGQPERLHQD